ncbi:MAG TPA: SMC family ATPase [Nocardioidaceae bacterium]|nr:SMC family ATPase [Nocardioidaceae bacterium]
MRLHELTMTAFGPFDGVEQVDFDELSESGLFLLTGPTGAGKTTILDAVCFALYGSVPGVRGVKALKSQHAPEDARPEVVLDFSVRGRRFLVRRSPEWTRPKRRGEGTTTENARATLIETTTGDEHLLSSRAQEVGHLIGDLIGMQSTQFVQVAMLPQGDFQKFLRASSQDRHEVLQHLFRTDRFSRIEEWVHDHSRRLKERSAAGEAQVLRVLDTIADRAGAEPPEALDEPLEWADQHIASAEDARAAAHEEHQAAATNAGQTRAVHDEAIRLHGLIARRDHALATLQHLVDGSDEAHAARRRVDADDRAARILPLLRMLDTAVRERERTAETWADAEARLQSLDLGDLTLPTPVTADSLTDLQQRVSVARTRLDALLPREKDLHATREELAASEADLLHARSTHEAVTERLAALPADLAAVRTRLADLSTSARRADSLRLELRQAQERAQAAQDAGRCSEQLSDLRDAERAARDAAADAREHMQELTARRLAGIAAELAGHLEAGRACQVCGSTEHPEPAQAGADAVTEAEQAAAADAYDGASAAHLAAGGEVVRAEERLDALRTAAGNLAPLDAQQAADELSTRLSESEQAEAEVATAEQLLAELVAEQEKLTSKAHEVATQVATLSQAVTTQQERATTLQAEISAALGTSGEATRSLTQQVAHLGQLVASIASARETLTAHETALGRVNELTTHAHDAAAEHGFSDVADLRSAVLTSDERTVLEQQLSSRQEAEARARAVLEDDEIRTLDKATEPDLARAKERLDTAQAEEATAARVLHQREEVAAALVRQRVRLEEALTEWGPLREEHHRAEGMAKLVRGMGADNQLQMRLSAYVLATRLDQVVAAANERLAHMRDQRYLLQRTGRAARKGAQAGLGLEILDQWTGEVRDPSTLSGGETFVVSLALALGLADVVTQEAGGTEVETLFVDEGFGTLDADTLDDVMDRLDDLRAGGRAVGVVSHVSELRNRIPTQLHVEKRRDGSSVQVRTAVG